MRYEDASGAFQASGPIANDDSDTLSAGQRGPATGNLITGEGTQYGSAGADSAAGAHITSIAGKGGDDSSFAGGKLSVAGEHGQLSVDAQGNYSYMANAGAPENVRDRFTYTLADNQGNSDTASLIVEIGKTPVVIKADAQQIVPGPDGVVTLPPGVELSDIMVVGRNLVINMPDGTQLVIVDGAVFVPQLVLDGVEVPASNVAALLIGQEPQPAAGETPPSSGGNFALPPPPLDPGVPLGDLIPPTEYNYQPPEPQEVFEQEDSEPEIFVQPDGQPASVNAVDSVDESGLPERDGDLPDEPEGTNAATDVETTTGTIIYDSPDTPNVITINGEDVVAVGQEIEGLYGILTITSIAPGAIGYSYTLTDNTDGNDTHDDFAVQLTDVDGDVANATLTINIIDDVPQARPDTDTLGIGETEATGNVMTDAAPGDVGDSDTNAADTVGADDATLTSVSGFGGSDSVFEGGLLQVNGQYGVLTIDAEGNYSYVKNEDAPGGVQDVFNYTITDGDGDTSSSTLTITIPDQFPDLPNPDAVLLDDDVIPGADGNPDGPGDDDPDVVGENVVNGQLSGSGGDGDLDYFFTGTNTLPAALGFTVDQVDASTLNVLQNGTIVLTVTLNNETGAFTVTQVNPIDHPVSGTEDNLIFQIGVEVEDADGDTDPATITINVDDDTPIALEGQVTGLVDEDGVLEGAADGGEGDGIAGGDGDVPNAPTVASGSVSTLFASGADAPLSYGFAANTIAVLEGLGLTSGGVPLDYAIVDDTVTASTAAGDVFTFELNANGSWTFTLIDQLDHPTLDDLPGDDTENDLTINLGAIIEATDADGDSVVGNANGLVITVDDDTPTAANDSDSVGEPGTSTTGNVLANDHSGADEPATVTDVVSVNEPGNSDTNPAAGVFEIQGEFGVLVLNADGSYEYTRDPGTPGGVDDVFTYTLTDADGDSVTATLTITLADDRPVATTSAATVDDEGLANGIPGGDGDLDANAGETPPANPNEAIFNGTLGGTPGDGTTTFFFPSDLDGDVVVVGQENVTLDVSPDGLTLTGTGPRGLLFTIQITDAEAGDYTLTLNDNVLHQTLDGAAGDNTENNATLVLDYQMEDADGDLSLSPGQLTITFDDDIPTATANQLTGTVDEDGVLEGADDNGPGDGIAGGTNDVAGEDVSAVGNVSTLFNPGADGPLTYSLLNNFAGLTAQNLSSGGVALAYSVGFAAGVYTLTATAGPGGDTVFTFTLNATTGAYNFTLVDQLDHPTLNGLAGDNTENDLTVNLSSIIQATDQDGDSVNAGANGLIITVDDDTPIATNVELTGTVDEDGVVEDATPGIQKGDGIAGGTGDVAGEVVTANGNVGALFQSGADEPLAYSLTNSFAALTAQGLTSGGVALSYSVGFAAGVYTLTATAGPGGDPVFTFTLNASTGAYTFTLIDQLDHLTLNGLLGDNEENDLTINLSSIIQATDFDGDTVSAGANGLIITVDDDSPKINDVDATLQIDNVGTQPTGSGAFDFDIGADENSDNDDIDVSNFTVSVNGIELDPADFELVEGVEDATAANYTFSFDYDTGTGGTATAEGTLIFYKTGPKAGTYEVVLTSGPIEGTSILETASGTLFQGYEFGTSNLDGSQPEISVTQIRGDPLDPQSTDLFVQFTSVSEPSSGTGDDNLEVTNWVPGSDNPPPVDGGGDNVWNAGQLFNQDDGWVSTSNDANGVDGDTIQGGEVIDFTLVQGANPTGVLADPSTYGQASSMFLKFDGIGAQEDMIVILKLYDPVNDVYTTKAVMITNSDIFKGPADNDPNTAAPSLPSPYQDIVLDNNDGFVVIESNDYNLPGETWVIVGAQIAGSDEGVTGDAINLNPAVGLGGDSDADNNGSLDTQSFSTDVNDGPFKISSIGFLTESTTEQSAELSFDVTIEDYDGDSLTQHIDVTIGETDSPMPVPLAAETTESLADTSSFSLLASDSQEQQLQKTAANSNTTLLAAAAAAAGLAESVAAERGGNSDHRGNGDDHSGQSSKNVDYSVSDDGGDAAVSMLVEDSAPADSAPADSSSSSSSAPAESSHSVDDGSASAASESSDGSDAGDDAPAEAANDTSPVAPAVAMVSAEALQAAAADDDGGKGGSVDQVVADALGHGNAPTVDAILANLPGGNGELAAISHMASPDSAAVSGWDMAGQVAFGATADMAFKVDVAMLHHDAVQPAVNG